MFAKLIKYKLVDKNIKVSDLARALNTSYQNIRQKMLRDNFSEKEMQQIADILNCELLISLKDKE